MNSYTLLNVDNVDNFVLYVVEHTVIVVVEQLEFCYHKTCVAYSEPHDIVLNTTCNGIDINVKYI